MPMLESMCWRPWAPWVQIDLSFAGPDGKLHPFHRYKMRWAIEEGFILDVLANYTSYKTYWRIEKAVSDDPQYDAAKAQVGLAARLEPVAEGGDHRRALPYPYRLEEWRYGQGDGGHLLPAPRRALQGGYRHLHPRQMPRRHRRVGGLLREGRSSPTRARGRRWE